MPEEQGKDLSVRVALRCRPLISKEVSEGCQQCVRFTPGEPQVILGKDKAFTYDYVFRPEEPQEVVHRKVVKNLVEGLFKGYNATVLAYGQTGSGKTYAMGNAYNITDEEKMGVIPRVIQQIFRGVEERQDVEVMLKVSYLEIYKEEIHDLLAPHKESLAIREDITGGIRVAGLIEIAVTSAEDMFGCLERGSGGRTTGSTAMNLQSSRSHAIFTVYMELRKKDSSESSCHAKFHLVDLAGSERAKRTQASGDRFKEGVNINRGLLALGNVISALGDEAGRKSHIPYRDSKLTRLLQDSLGGNSQTVMIACISPADSNLEETLNTLRYADRARRIKNKPIVNRDPHAAELNKLKQQVQQLQIQLLQGNILNGPGDLPTVNLEGSADLKTLLERNKYLEAENEKLSTELQSSIDQMTHMCEKVILAEMSRDKLKQKLLELRATADQSIGALDLTMAEGDFGDHDMTRVKEQLGAMKELQQKIVEMEAEHQKEDQQHADELYGDADSSQTTAASENDDASSPRSDGESSAPINEVAKTHALRQAALSRELHELNQALLTKQKLAETMGQSDEKIAALRIQYETTTKQLEDQVNTLVKEKETLSHELHSTKANSASNKLSEQRRKRLHELEGQISDLKKKMNNQAKLLKLKEKSDQRVNSLNTDILSMKQARVRLMKQMKEDAGRFQQLKQAKDKEVMQLKAKDRKRQIEFTKLERQNQKTQNVLRRKMEEASAANRRLREALDKKNKARNVKQEPNKLEGMGKRIKSWIDHELEVKVSVNEAKRHLGSLLNDRKTLSREMGQLDRCDPTNPPARLNGKSVSVRQEELQSEMELRNAQISDLQQKIMDADHDEKSQTNRWNHVTSMPEAKCCIDRLMEAATLARVEMACLENRLRDVKADIQEAHHDKEEVDELMNEMKLKYEQERTEIQRAHEDKILYLLTQLSSVSDKVKGHEEEVVNGHNEGLRQRLHFQEEQIEELRAIHDQLQETLLENSDLKKQLTVATYQGKKSALMPVLTSPEASPMPPPKPKKKKSTAEKDVNRYTIEEFFSDDSDVESEYEYDSVDDDSDWHETPVKKRKKAPVSRRSSQAKNSSNQSCRCKSNCKSRVCGCVKNGKGCGDDCRCDSSKCENRKGGEFDDADQSGDINTTTTTTTVANSSDMMNTTIVLDSSKSETDGDTPGLNDFKLPHPKHQHQQQQRKVLAPLNSAPGTNRGSTNAPHASKSSRAPFTSKSSNALKPKLKRENAMSAPLVRKRSSETMKSSSSSFGMPGAMRKSGPDVENEGIVKRKRKLLGSTNGSFFKPLDV